MGKISRQLLDTELSAIVHTLPEVRNDDGKNVRGSNLREGRLTHHMYLTSGIRNAQFTALSLWWLVVRLLALGCEL